MFKLQFLKSHMIDLLIKYCSEFIFLIVDEESVTHGYELIYIKVIYKLQIVGN